MGAEAKRTHRRLLAALIREGRPPTDLDPAIVDRLAAEDVIVTEAGRIAGAYPFSLVATPHRIRIGDTSIYAMCAIDALAISAVWKVSTRTESECAVTGAPIRVEQQPGSVVAEPSDLRLGVRWQAPRGSASTSMCREMVFLADPSVARRWQRDGAEASIYTLQEGVEFGRRFFDPLLVD
jgi:mercuric reductase